MVRIQHLPPPAETTPDLLVSGRGLIVPWRGHVRPGRVQEAADQFSLLLADRVRVLDPDHPDTLTTREFWHATAPGGTLSSEPEPGPLLPPPKPLSRKEAGYESHGGTRT